MELVEVLREKITPLLAEQSVELVEIVFRSEGRGRVLRILVDKIQTGCAEGAAEEAGRGITLGECVELNNRLSAWLDQENLIDEHFLLEVSSPGVDRPLVTRNDFLRCRGRRVSVTTSPEYAGARCVQGKVRGVQGEELELETEAGGCVRIPLTVVARARQVVNFH